MTKAGISTQSIKERESKATLYTSAT